jgi:hypothetical protein
LEQLEKILQHRIAQLNRARFCVSSERLAGQAELFDAATDLPVPPAGDVVPVAGHTRKGRPALPKDLPRACIEYDLSDEQKMPFDTARAYRRRAQRDAALRALQAHRHRAHPIRVRGEEGRRIDHRDSKRSALTALLAPS